MDSWVCFLRIPFNDVDTNITFQIQEGAFVEHLGRHLYSRVCDDCGLGHLLCRCDYEQFLPRRLEPGRVELQLPHWMRGS